jgi:hypothetical protein
MQIFMRGRGTFGSLDNEEEEEEEERISQYNENRTMPARRDPTTRERDTEVYHGSRARARQGKARQGKGKGKGKAMQSEAGEERT